MNLSTINKDLILRMLPPLVLGDHKGIRNLVSDMCFLNTDSGEKSNKCKQCNYASSDLGNLRTHLKIHSREKSNKCNQCDYASSRAGDLKRHLKTHSGEKSNRCSQCDFASYQTGNLRTHLKTHSGEKVKQMQPL